MQAHSYILKSTTCSIVQFVWGKTLGLSHRRDFKGLFFSMKLIEETDKAHTADVC